MRTKTGLTTLYGIPRTITIALAVMALFIALFAFGTDSVAASTSAPYATGRIDSSSGVNVRKSPSTTSSVVMGLADNTKVTVCREVFTSKTKYSRKYKWFYISYKGKKGYVRSDLMDGIRYTKLKSMTTDGINYRKGAGADMPKVGTINTRTTVYVVLAATNRKTGDKWYKIRKNLKYYYVSATYVKLGTVTTGASSPDPGESWKPIVKTPTSAAAKALRAKATTGGSRRIVYTFDENNCSRKFGVTGHNGITTPQAMAFTGSKYYLLYATSSGQRMVTYSESGKRLDAVNFDKNRGHLNGLTWNPKTGKCYIFKGNQNTIYTWNPSTNKFSTLKTPYSSSGAGYDRITKKVYCSSQTGIRVYSADDKFSHEKLFSRCTHSGTTYIQDCGAHYGIVFHGVSGSNKATTNYIDFYRASSGKYLGTVKVAIGEIESFTVNDDGYLEMLINKPGHTDYIWKTPLKVKELA